MRIRPIWLSLFLVLQACGEPTRFHAFAPGDEVAYVAGDVPDGWNARDFDDSRWLHGPTRLFEVPPLTYVRGRFDAGPQATQVTRLELDLDVRNADFDASVNGVQVAHARAPVHAVVELPAGTLLPSGNVFALRVAGHAGQMASVGVSIDPADLVVPAGIVRGPYLQALREDGATVVFDTAASVPARVVVDGRAFAGAAATHHEIAVSGFQPATRHAYQVEAGGARSEELSFATAPTRGEPVTLLVYGDTRTDGDADRRLCAAMARESADAALATGDLVYESSAGEWDTFFAAEYGFLARTPLFPTVGNHDAGGGAARFRDAFALPGDERIYAFDVGDVHVAVLDSNQDLAPQAKWLDADLTAARAAGARHLFVAMHHGPYSAGESHGGSAAARATIVPVARAHGVDAIFSGHDHIYERGKADGLRYFVSGGGGAPIDGVSPTSTTERAFSAHHYLLVRVTGPLVTVEAHGPTGELLDQVAFSSPGG